MTSVPSSTVPLVTGLPPPPLEAAPTAAQAGRVRGTGADVVADVVLEGVAAKAGSTKSPAASKSSKTSTAKKKTTTTAAKSGYAASASLPKDLAFLRDPKLSVEEKLVRFLAYVNARSEAELTRKMEEMGGAAPVKASGTASGDGTTAPKPKKKKGFWGTLLDAAKTGLPAVGLGLQVLKNPTTKAMLKELGGPVLAAAVSAFGFPQAAALVANLGPKLVDYAAAGLQAVEKAAAAEEKASVETTSKSSSSGSTASASASGNSEQLQMLELNRLMNKQKEMFSLVSNMLRSMHDTRSHIIGNLR